MLTEGKVLLEILSFYALLVRFINTTLEHHHDTISGILTVVLGSK